MRDDTNDLSIHDARPPIDVAHLPCIYQDAARIADRGLAGAELQFVAARNLFRAAVEAGDMLRYGAVLAELARSLDVLAGAIAQQADRLLDLAATLGEPVD